MTRMQTIEQITAKLATLDDERLQAVAEMIEGMDDAESVLPRALTERELALIEQSKEDFKAGRIVSQDDYRVEMDAFLSQRRAKLPKSA